MPVDPVASKRSRSTISDDPSLSTSISTVGASGDACTTLTMALPAAGVSKSSNSARTLNSSVGSSEPRRPAARAVSASPVCRVKLPVSNTGSVAGAAPAARIWTLYVPASTARYSEASPYARSSMIGVADPSTYMSTAGASGEPWITRISAFPLSGGAVIGSSLHAATRAVRPSTAANPRRVFHLFNIVVPPKLSVSRPRKQRPVHSLSRIVITCGVTVK